jgi:CHC2 zinc finger
VSKKPSSSTPAAAKNLSEKQLRRIWQDLAPQPVLERLKTALPAARWSLSGFRISGRCPFHADSTPSFHIYLDRGYAKCFGCEVFLWNPIELWAKLRQTGYNEALQDLKQQFGLKFLGASVQTQLREWDKNQTLKRRIVQICHDELLRAVAEPEKYPHAKDAVEWLLKTRQVPADALPTLPMLGVLPPLGRFLQTFQEEARLEDVRLQAEAEENGTKPRKAVSLEDDTKAYLDGLQGWIGSVVFRLDVAPDAIGRLKLRRPHTKDIRIVHDAFEEELGFFGLGWEMYRPLLGTGAQSKYVEGVYAVEGEFDALSTMARMVGAGGPTYVVVSVGGAGTVEHIDNLRHSGFTKVYLVGDRDEGGVGNVKKWLEKVKHLRAFVFTGWDRLPGQTHDPDEAVLAAGLNEFSRVLLDIENKETFQTPPEWVYEQAYPELAAVPESDVRFRIESAGTWGRYLKNSIECDIFVDLCAKSLGLPAAQLKREIVAREEDEPAFILRLADSLLQEFYPMGQRSTDSDRRLFLWYKSKREVVNVGLADDGSIERELGNKLGPSYQYFHEKVGVPSFLELPDTIKEQGKYLQRIDKDYRFYYRQALTIISQNVPDFDTAEHKGQGLHVDRTDDGSPPTLYLVNGRDIYHGTYDTGDALSWTKLDGPSHSGIVFDVGIHHVEDTWLKRIHSATDLARAKEIDPQSLWHRLHPVLDLGWAFKNHALNVDFLTAHLLATTINNAFRRQVVVSFQADTSAGKSKLNLGLIAGTEKERLHLIEAAVGMQRFTPAGIRMTMNNKVRPLCLDEFEDDGTADKMARYVQETLDMFRNLTGEQNTFTMGSRGGDAVKYNIRMFVFLSAINPARKVQDANRMIVVNMDRRKGRAGPEDVIPQELGWNYMEALKYDLSIGLFPHIAKIQQAYNEIEYEFGKPGAKPQHVDQRYFEALFPAMSIMKFMGRDYRTWALNFCGANATPQDVAAENTDSSQLFNWLLQSGEIIVRGDNGEISRASALQLLASPELRNKLNTSASGLFYDEASQLLVVAWTQAIQGVLHKHARYGREVNIYNLREIANRSPYAVKADDLVKSGALARLKSYGLAFIPATQLTGYRVNDIIKALDEAPQPQPVFASAATAAQRTSDDGDFASAG